MEHLHDLNWMRVALKEAELAKAIGEIPVGAVIVRDGELLAKAHNLCIQDRCATAHAEILAIEEACQKLDSWRLSGCTLYVTLEPCPMCAGAVINSRISRVVFAAKDPRAGAFGSLLNLSAYPLEAHPICEYGLCAEESLSMLRDFFKEMRKKNKSL